MLPDIFQWSTKNLGIEKFLLSAPATFMKVLLTFIGVVIAWVYFRADNLTTAHSILLSMAGCTTQTNLNEVFNSQSVLILMAYLVLSGIIIWIFPNIYEAIDLAQNRILIKDIEGERVVSMLSCGLAILMVSLFLICILTTFGTNITSPFLYFRF